MQDMFCQDLRGTACFAVHVFVACARDTLVAKGSHQKSNNAVSLYQPNSLY
jgi:hypothetical protein